MTRRTAKRVCNWPSCPTISDSPRCPTHTREADQARGNRHQRDYGADHVKERNRLLPLAYGTPCRYCEHLMWPHEHLVLDHTEDRSAYRGIVHADYRDCPAGGNASEGATRGNLERRN